MFDIVKNYEKVSDDLIKKYDELSESASINEVMPVSGALTHDFRPIWPGIKSVGRAFTVRARAGDNLILHKAITMLKPYDILMVTCDGFQESGGMWGGIMSNAAMKMGCRGLVIDGCVRDTMMMKKSGFNVWARGISVKRSTKLTGGQINNPIVIGNVAVNPGDLVFADNDAVVVVPRQIAEETLQKALAREEKEEHTLQEALKDGTYCWTSGIFPKTFASLGLTEEE